MDFPELEANKESIVDDIMASTNLSSLMKWFIDGWSDPPNGDSR
jgi:hypothetical protein